ncbi:MAG: glycosyltransferase family 2 protein [Deltaproteobacteria bacterium]|nr:glycosyltransferase family 2 protein [Deltaproteobacteria bacterium]
MTTAPTEPSLPAPPAENRPPRLSVVLPAHNEAAGLARALAEIGSVLATCGVTYELLVVDDGSRDRTFDEIQALAAADRCVRGIRLSRNFGKEAALLAGLEAARGDAVVTIDADLQHPPHLIPELLDRWRAGARVVHAVKRDRSHDTRMARWRSAAFHGLLTRLGGVDVRNSSDFKLLDRAVVDALVTAFPERSRFYRGLADWVGFEQASVPFDVAPREAGHGKWSLGALLGLATTALVSFTSAPLRIVTSLGFLTLAFGALVAADTVWSRFQGTAVSGFATLEITLLFLGSLIMISLGIVGEYIAKIYDETKHRPAYLVASTCGFEEKDPGGTDRGER